MADDSKRARGRRGIFQLHLGTAVLLLLAAAGLIGLNTIRRAEPGTRDANFEFEPLPGKVRGELDRSAFTWGLYGWPCVVYVDSRFSSGHAETHRIQAGSVFLSGQSVEIGWNWRGFALNAISVFGALAIFGIFVERVAYRRKSSEG